MATNNTELTSDTLVDHRGASRKRTRPIQSLDRGLALLQAVGNSRRPMSLVLALATQTGETSHLAVREGVQAVFVDHELTLQPLGVSVGTGQAEPLHCTALGKALMADFDHSRLTDLLDGSTLPRLTKRTICTIQALAGEIKRTRRRGYAVDDEEFHEGVRCVAAPIRDASGAVTAAIGVSAPAGRVAKHRFGKVGQQVKDVAAQVSAKLCHGVQFEEDAE